MEPTLIPGRALILAGPQGSSKTQLARELARAFGKFAEIHVEALYSPFGIGYELRCGVRTFIVEGVPIGRDSLNSVKCLITNGQVWAHVKGQPPVMVDAPNFIFCTGDPDVLLPCSNDRRFFVHRMPAHTQG